MFAHFSTLISRFPMIFTLVFLVFLKESMFFSKLLIFSCELSLTVLQNYRIRAFVNLWLTPLKYQKVEKQQQNR